MAGWLELDAVTTTTRGELAEALQRSGVPTVDVDITS
jgi:hypothetical protein